jgi:uncharacterized protein involved in outer membrane biogenesis
MNKKILIFGSVITSLLLLVIPFYLYGIPKLIDLEKYKTEIQNNIKQETGLNIDLEDPALSTTLDLGIVLQANNLKVNYENNDELANIKKVSAKIQIVPLLFKKIEISELKLEKPELYLTKLQNGKYNVESLFPPSDKGKKQGLKFDIDKINLLVKDYKLNYKDESLKTSKTLSLVGEKLNIIDFNPNKSAKLEAVGKLLVNNTPKINFNIKLKTELPLGNEQTEEKRNDNTTEPLKNLLQYDLQGDLTADLKIKNTKKLPQIIGNLDFKNLSLNIDNEKISGSYGKIIFLKDKFSVNSKVFVDSSSFIDITGDILSLEKENFDINVKSNTIELKKVKKIIAALAKISNVQAKTLNAIDISGKLKADFKMHSVSRKNDFKGYLNLSDVQVYHKGISKPLKNLNLTVNFDKDKLRFVDSSGYIEDIKFNINGFVNPKGLSDLNINMPKVSMSTVYQILKSSPLIGIIQNDLKNMPSMSGYISANVSLKGDMNKEIYPVVKISMINPSFKHKQLGQPILLTKGGVVLDQNEVKIDNIQASLYRSPINISGKITNISGKNPKPKMDITMKGQFAANNIGKFLSSDMRKLTKAKGTIPINAALKGYLDDWNLILQAKLDNSNYIAYFADIDNYKNQPKIIHLDANGDQSSIKINNMMAFAAANLAKDSTGFYKTNSAGKILDISGKIDKFNTSDPTLKTLKVEIPEYLSVKPFTIKETQAKVGGSLILNGKTSNPDIAGSLNLAGITSAPNLFKTESVNVNFAGNKILVNLNNANLIDSNFQGKATLSKKLTLPVIVENIEVSSNYINADKLSQKFPSKPGDMPIIIKNGTFTAKRVITNNLVNSDVGFDFNINRPNILKISNLHSNVAKGQAKGNIELNLKNTGVKVDLTAHGIEVNTLATSANMPNEIYGTLDGNINLYTHGITPDQISYNADGRATFTIRNGRLVKLGSFQYLMKAPNLISTGLSSYQFNNIVNTVANKNTESFEILEGKVSFRNGVINVQEIKSKGKNLSLFAKGSVYTKNNNANLTVLGRTSGDVTRLLSPLRQLSLSKLTNKIPYGQIGAILIENKLSYSKSEYPDKEFIPVLSSSNSATADEGIFAVVINGNISDMKSVKSFKWLD